MVLRSAPTRVQATPGPGAGPEDATPEGPRGHSAASARRARGPLVAGLVVAATVLAVAIVAAGVDGPSFGRTVRALASQPLVTGAALLAFTSAFALRSWAWCRVLPGLSLGHAWAGIHLALLGNHVLPLRLGEPLRVLSVVRRTPVLPGAAAATTVTLRAGDLVALLLVSGATAAVAVGQGALAWLDTTALRVAAVALIGLLGVGLAWTWRLRGAAGAPRLPGPLVVAATVLAWVAESVLTLVVARAAGLELDLAQAVLVSTAAVLAQIAAITPGGFGTYEAGATAAYVVLGFDAGAGLAAALAAHALKTLYAVGVGAVALVVPAPTVAGRLRLGPVAVRASLPVPTRARDAPVVLFLPAHDEEAAVASVVHRVPATVLDHPVVVLVVDDGSTDATAAAARGAGATVLVHDGNRGLGAAVRTGLRAALAYEPAAVAFCDADGEYAPEELGRLVHPVLDGSADYVIGSRFTGDIDRMLPHRRLGNLVLTRVLSFVARRPVSDGQSGYRAFSPSAARDAEVVHDFNYAQVITLDLLGKGYRYAEVPISYSFRTTGTSFVRLGRYLRAVVPAVHRELNAEAPAPAYAGSAAKSPSPR